MIAESAILCSNRGMVFRFLMLLALITGLLQPVPVLALSSPDAGAEAPCLQHAQSGDHCDGDEDCRCAQACGGLVMDVAVFTPPKPPVEPVTGIASTRVLPAFLHPPFRPPIR